MNWVSFIRDKTAIENIYVHTHTQRDGHLDESYLRLLGRMRLTVIPHNTNRLNRGAE